MSKKYFVKYLPVDGKVEAGDMCMYYCSDGIQVARYTYEKKGQLYIIHGDIRIEYNGEKKAKLFLCSRDIQVGDKNIWLIVDNLLFKGVTAAKLNEHGVLCTTIENAKDTPIDINPGDFKSIGEISPDVVWINEREEFDENQIEFTLFKHIPYYIDWTEAVTENTYLQTKNRHKSADVENKAIRILCPTCKTYH